MNINSFCCNTTIWWAFWNLQIFSISIWWAEWESWRNPKTFEGFLNMTYLVIMYFYWEIPFYVKLCTARKFLSLTLLTFLIPKNLFLTDNVTVDMDYPLKEAKYPRNIWRESVTSLSLATLIHEINSQLPKWSLQSNVKCTLHTLLTLLS